MYICIMALQNRPLKDILTSILFLAVMALLGFSIVWAYLQYRYSPPYVDEQRYPVRGIDVSRHNGDIDFNKVADEGYEFVFVKASEGINHRDSLYRENVRKARQAGLKTGAYHFFRFDRDGIAQAVNFLEAVGPHHPDLGLVIDVESAGNPKGIPPDSVKKKLLSMVEYMNLLGHRVMIYTNFDGYYDYMEEILPGYPLWICRFQENPINAEWTFWQYDHHGRVPGIKGDVDLNAFNGSRQQWLDYISGKY